MLDYSYAMVDLSMTASTTGTEGSDSTTPAEDEDADLFIKKSSSASTRGCQHTNVSLYERVTNYFRHSPQ